MKRYLWPLVIFFVLLGFLAIGLKLDPRHIPSPLIGQPAPSFRLPRLDAPGTLVQPQNLQGQVWLFNVWASWCVSCQQEHRVLLDLARTRKVPIYGLNYKDQSAAALNWLTQHGNPYVYSLSDPHGIVGIDYGVYGVPETFVIDKQGVIRHKHTGPVTSQDLHETLLPLVEKLNAL
ncbi:MAG: DsbE family thiol:disulfide interchange protein [Burkholderiales bacterium]